MTRERAPKAGHKNLVIHQHEVPYKVQDRLRAGYPRFIFGQIQKMWPMDLAVCAMLASAEAAWDPTFNDRELFLRAWVRMGHLACQHLGNIPDFGWRAAAGSVNGACRRERQ
jgi:hypothetical protein